MYERDPESGVYRIIGAYGASSSGNDVIEKQKSASDQSSTINSKRPLTQKPQAESASHRPKINQVYDQKGRRLFKPGELLIRLKENVSKEDIAKVHESLGSKVMDSIPRLNLQKINLRKGLDEDAAARLYLETGLVKIAEKHALRYKNAEPDDPYFDDQWGMQMIQAPEAWDKATGSESVVVAVIDTGVDCSHPDLVDNIWINVTEQEGIAGVDDDANGYVDDVYGWDFAGDGANEDNAPADLDGHGTHVAGIVAARGNNTRGVAGVCWNLEIMPLKVQADGAESMETWDIIQALDYARENGARVINCSYGGSAFEDTEYDTLSMLKDQGILAVCAAGNDGKDNDGATKNYPASYNLENVLSVASNQEDGNFYSGSNYGQVSVDLMAPGMNIRSTVPAGTYSEALVTTNVDGNISTFESEEMTFSGRTDQDGISGSLHDCGIGKSPDDFPAGVSGNLALIERGDIYFSEKAANAMAAGAVGVIIYNNVDEAFHGTLGTPADWVPVVLVSKPDGAALKTMLSDEPDVTLVNQLSTSEENYAVMSGTSMATPHVTGAAALLLSVNPNLDYAGLKSIIMRTVDPVEGAADKMVSGGRANVYAAVTAAGKGDFDCDGKVGIGDIITTLKVVSGSGYAACQEPTLMETDPDGDGRISLSDAVYLMQVVSGRRY